MIEKKKLSTKNELLNIVKTCYKGKNKVKFMISERGNQRIEITDEKTKKVWQTLEATEPQEDMKNFEDISEAMIQSLMRLERIK